MRMISEFMRHILPGVVRPLHALWNQIIGFIFLVIAVFVGASIWRRAEHLTGDLGGLLLLISYCLFALLLAWLGVSSFLKARKISRS